MGKMTLKASNCNTHVIIHAACEADIMARPKTRDDAINN